MRERVGSDQNWPTVGALAVLLVAVLIPFCPVLTGREAFWFFDVTLFHHPNYTLLKQALVSHDLSAVIWNPDVGTGFPLWAEGQIGGLYPPNWIMVALFDPLAAPKEKGELVQGNGVGFHFQWSPGWCDGCQHDIAVGGVAAADVLGCGEIRRPAQVCAPGGSQCGPSDAGTGRLCSYGSTGWGRHSVLWNLPIHR